MRKDYRKYCGISLSVIIKRDLRKLKMTQKSLAAQVGISYRQLNRQLNSSCRFNPITESRIERILGYETAFICNLRNLQIENARKHEAESKMIKGRKIPSIRKCVFWDINPDALDWARHRKFIIARVNRYGNEQEKESVSYFYNQ